MRVAQAAAGRGWNIAHESRKQQRPLAIEDGDGTTVEVVVEMLDGNCVIPAT